MKYKYYFVLKLLYDDFQRAGTTLLALVSYLLISNLYWVCKYLHLIIGIIFFEQFSRPLAPIPIVEEEKKFFSSTCLGFFCWSL